MKENIRANLKKLLIVPPIVIGALFLAFVIQSRSGPTLTEARETVSRVRTIEIQPLTVIPRALGYGNVQPGKVWQAVAEVGGKIVTMHPQLKKGAILVKGEVLVKIDPSDYQLAIVQIDASISAVRAQLAELKVRAENTRISLKIEQRVLELSEKDLDRKRRLLTRKAASQANVDQEERTVLNRRQTVQNLKNTLNLIPAEQDVQKAQMALYQAQLKAARLNLERTTLTAPFDIRIAAVNVELAQFAATGKVLIQADGMDVSEVSAQVPIGKLINLIPAGTRFPDLAKGVMDLLPGLLSLSAQVRLSGGNVDAVWSARFSRISDTIDPKTRTVGVIVAVDDPYRHTLPGVRPPLTKNMYVEVELKGKPKPGQIVVPRSALHGATAYVVNEDNRLERRAVEIAFRQSGFAIINKGLKAGDILIVSDPVPAIEGMLLDPVRDAKAAAALSKAANGNGAVK